MYAKLSTEMNFLVDFSTAEKLGMTMSKKDEPPEEVVAMPQIPEYAA
jgi:hypothetical protein